MATGTRKRTYLETHPWIKFGAIELDRAPWDLWMLLGEAQSKIEHIAGVPLRPDLAKELHLVYLVKGAHATTAIEGNTLTEAQVRARVEGKLTLPRSQEYLGKEVDNIVAAYNEIKDSILEGGDQRITPEVISRYDLVVLRNLELDEGVVAGKYREHQVTVARYLGAPSQDLDYLVDRMCEWLNGPEFQAKEDNLVVAYAIIKAVVAHLYLAWIHPFGDGNGRTARLLEYQILVASGVPTPAGHLLSNHYNLTRADYYRQLDRTSRSGGDLLPFLCYAVQGFVDQLREQLALIKSQQWDVTWRNYVHQLFDGQHGPTHARRLHLVLDLSRHDKPMARSELRELSARVAHDYASKTDKTLTRDLNELMKMGLVVREPAGYVANRSAILAFLPRALPKRVASNGQQP